MDDVHRLPRGQGLRTGTKVALGCALSLGVMLILALVLYVVISLQFQTIHVLGPAMAPTLNSDDFFVGTRLHRDDSKVQRGDIVVYTAPGTGKEYISRVIAAPGDRIRVSHAVVTVNGEQRAEAYLPEAWTWRDTWNNGNEDTVPSKSLFVMGDNRNHSTDSRLFGYLPTDSVLVKATMRVKPRFGEKL